MIVNSLKLHDVKIIEPVVHGDHRGFLWKVIMSNC